MQQPLIRSSSSCMLVSRDTTCSALSERCTSVQFLGRPFQCLSVLFTSPKLAMCLSNCGVWKMSYRASASDHSRDTKHPSGSKRTATGLGLGAKQAFSNNLVVSASVACRCSPDTCTNNTTGTAIGDAASTTWFRTQTSLGLMALSTHMHHMSAPWHVYKGGGEGGRVDTSGHFSIVSNHKVFLRC